jgi:formylglycine-generating enzyme required for sulfatase activity
MSVAATTPTGTLSYQWFRDGAAIPGATTASYDAKGSGGKYFVRISNGANSVDSAAVEPPCSELKDLALSGVGLTPAFSSSVAGYTGAVGYGVGAIKVTATAAQVGAVLAARVNGSASWSALVSGQAGDDVPLVVGNNTVEVRVTAKDSKTVRVYTVSVQRLDSSTLLAGGAALPSGDVWNAILENYLKPKVTMQPAAAAGGVRVEGASPVGKLTYQWYQDGSAISGQTTQVLDSDAVSAAARSLKCRISNGLVEVDSVAWSTSLSERRGLVPVSGGTLPEASLLAGQVVQDFLVGKYEVTWGEWKAVRAWATGNGYDIGSVGQGSADDHPVRSVTWYEALKWCNARSEMEGLVPVYRVDGAVYRSGSSVPTSLVAADGYRLPLEREWEWAARGGASSKGYTYSGGNVATEVGWFATNSVNSPIPLWTSGGNVDMGTWPVGKKAGNELGVYDMSGNVREWCWDAAGGERRLRGGVWAYGPELMSVGAQDKAPADYRNDFQGFRVAANANLVVVDGGKLPETSGLSGQIVSGFQIGRYEVTWAEWKAVRSWASGKGYDLGSAGQGSADSHPVRNVSWYEVLKWCNARSEMEGLVPVYLVSGAVYRSGESAPSVRSTANGYRLPLEAEWEWAAMGGASSKGYTYSGGNTVGEVAWYEVNSEGAAVELNGSRGTWPVGSKAANEIGIFDMSGNVWEFCWDTGKRLRGGSWNDPAYREESKDRGYEDFATAEPNIGFRVARNRNFSAMVLVKGGTLPSSSGLSGQVVGDFWIGKCEVTWGEWKAVREWGAGKGYDLANVGAGSGDDHPVREVSWYDVLKWSNARSEKEGLKPVYSVGGSVYRSGESVPDVSGMANGYRLPLEAEWEWAARGGVSSKGYVYSGSNDLNEVGWYGENSGGAAVDFLDGKGTWAVGRKKGNELGLYDMSGNVWEWCWEVYDGTWFRRLRGGSWHNNAGNAQVAHRVDRSSPDYRYNDSGFRLARSSGY